jgi:predicted Zn-dependent protease
MTQAGYSPIGILQVMKILAAAGGGSRQPEFFKSHPDPSNRLETLNALIAKTYPNGVPKTLDEGRDRFDQYARSRS